MTQRTVSAIPCVDWEESVRLAAGKEQVAKELLDMLLDELPYIKRDILQSKKEKNILKMSRLVHRLNGAACYCGVPQIRASAAKLELAIKEGNDAVVPKRLERLIFDIDNILEWGRLWYPPYQGRYGDDDLMY